MNNKNNKNTIPEKYESGEITPWIIIFILMVAFWPVGLFLLLKKLNVLTNSSKHEKRAYIKPEDSSTRARETQAQKAKVKTKKGRNALDKKTGKSVSVILLLISIALFFLGTNTIAGAAHNIWVNNLNRWPDLFLGAFYFIGAIIMFSTRNIGVKRLARYKRYHLLVSERGIVPLDEISRATGFSSRIVKRDIQAMINEGYLTQEAYIDSRLGCLVLSAEAAEEMRRSVEDSVNEPQAATVSGSDNQFMGIINEIREVRGSIIDASISNKTVQIEELSAKIFRIVDENPEKMPQIRRLLDYYMPTTIKLLRSYATLEKQDIKGENITTSKESIERILDTLVKGYEQQLDQLFKLDALDIAADINVIENLMQQDGLAENKPELRVMEGV